MLIRAGGREFQPSGRNFCKVVHRDVMSVVVLIDDDSLPIGRFRLLFIDFCSYSDQLGTVQLFRKYQVMQNAFSFCLCFPRERHIYNTTFKEIWTNIFFSLCIFCHLHNFLNKSGECSRCDEYFDPTKYFFLIFIWRLCLCIIGAPFHSSQRTEGRYACGSRNTVLARHTPGPGLRTRLCAQWLNTERRRRLALDSYSCFSQFLIITLFRFL